MSNTNGLGHPSLSGNISEPQTTIAFGPFEASVQINGQKTRCYAIDNDNSGKQVTSWIASEVGQKFSFSLTKTETQCHCEVTGFVNGKNIGCPPSDDKEVHDLTRLSGAAENEKGKFKIQIRRASGLFYSDVKDYKAEYLPEMPERNKEHTPEVHNNIHEGSTNFMPHQIGLAKTHSLADFDNKYFKRVHELLATFVFVYRPIGLLQKMNIAPSLASPPNLEGILTFDALKPISQSTRTYVQDMPAPDHLWTPRVTAIRDQPIDSTTATAINPGKISTPLGSPIPSNAAEEPMESIHGVAGNSLQVGFLARTPSPIQVDSLDTTPTLSSLYDLLNPTSRGGDDLQPTGNSGSSFSSLSNIPRMPSMGVKMLETSALIAVDEEETRLLMELEKLESRKYQLKKERKALAAASRRVIARAGSPEMIDLTID
ncbi:hypothetical protein HYPSUDRAFT_58379 [Hypholoma sublateritium FD-334 SS-4]|uniref:Uncharacterized protein n=1 Tax=Hypholoma sublateritium (strain FD-334 SS-4) TaxID=945553 RepID=A0A0D2NAQ8_HYPSF|nr:hypothetical protein HYPSUDRAFT_58379 [Hypholoma sublateritium FD-334 SS-4]